MQQHMNHTAPVDTGASTARQIIATAQTFTRAQVADLLRVAFNFAAQASELAYRDGTEAARAELGSLMMDALAHPSVHEPFSESALHRAGHQRRARWEADVAAAHPWHGDYPGGAVPASLEIDQDGNDVPGWPADREAIPIAQVSTRIRRTAAGLVWADE